VTHSLLHSITVSKPESGEIKVTDCKNKITEYYSQRNISNHKTNTRDKRIRNQLRGVTTIVNKIGREPLTPVLHFTLDSTQLFGVDQHGGIRGTFCAICQLPRHDCGGHHFLLVR